MEGMPVVTAGLLLAVFLWYPIKYTWGEGDDVLIDRAYRTISCCKKGTMVLVSNVSIIVTKVLKK